MSKSHYLSGWRCGRPELHVVCTEQFVNTWSRLLRSFNITQTERSAARHDEYRSKSSSRTESTLIFKGKDALDLEQQVREWLRQLDARRAGAESDGSETFDIFSSQPTPEGMSDDQAKFVRRCLYPWDTIVHAWACTRAGQKVSRFVEDRDT